MEKLKKRIKKAVNQFKASIIESWYMFCWNHFPLKEKSILLQSRYGDDLGGNIFYLLKELSQNYRDYTLYLSYKKATKEKYVSYLRKYEIKNVHLVCLHHFSYWRLLATCKYLINDVTFHARFIKRDGQRYLNTWHGTPLKKMGYEEAQSNYAAGNMQRNFLACDYLLCPNTYMTELMVRAYSLKNLFRGKILNEGYPRNAIFFDKARAVEVRRELGIENRQVIMYMPTWRGNSGTNKSKDYIEQLEIYLNELDQKLTDTQLFFVKLHPFVTAAIDLNKYTHIKALPQEYETYDFLNAADCLVSDYSSIMFDFACSGKNIVLFNYDEEDYLRDRGIYIDMMSLPFSKAQNVDALLSAIEKTPKYLNDQFMGGIVEFENPKAAQRICEQFLYNIDLCKTVTLSDNGKENVFIYIELLTNGITSAAFSLLNSIDVKQRNYFCVFNKSQAASNKEKLFNIPNGVGISSLDSYDYTLLELFASFFYFILNVDNGFIRRYIDRHFNRMFLKYYGQVRHDVFIQFVGYGRNPINLFRCAPRKFIFVHNNMKEELAKKKNQHVPTLLRAYRCYDKVAGVSHISTAIACELSEGAKTFCKEFSSYDCTEALRKAQEEIALAPDSDYITNYPGDIQDFLDTDAPKFISLGEHKSDKDYVKLLEAFNMYRENIHQATRLILIDKSETLSNEIFNYARKLHCDHNICIIKALSNPYPIIKKCDLLICFANQDRVLPVSILGAICLGVPVLSTDFTGAHNFFDKLGGGIVTSPSSQALYGGMLEYNNGNLKTLNIGQEGYPRLASTYIDCVLALFGKKYNIVHNCFDALSVKRKGDLPLTLDANTDYVTSCPGGITEILQTTAPKFVTVGRFSPEKQHKRLIQAFNLYWQNINQNARLIIIGGYGAAYNSTVKFARQLPSYGNICIIRSLSNPFSILKQCNLFILPSSHEGLPVVFFEADCFSLPILSTNIDGSRELLTTYGGGLLVEQSVEAIYEGMLEFDKGNIKPLNIDMDIYNNKCLAEFDALFD